MARPKKDTHQRRIVRLEIRLTTDEERVLLDRSQERGLNLSDFVRVSALSVRPRMVQTSPERAALINGLAQLGKIGSNVNQIARALNREAAGCDDAELVPPALVVSVLTYLETLSSQLIHDMQHGH